MKIDRSDNLSAKDIKRLLIRVYRDLKTGELSETQAIRETSILSSVLKAIELTDMEERLSKIERQLSE